MAITRIADATNGIRAGYSPITSITANRNLDFRDAGAILSSTTNANITLTLTDDTTGNWPSNSRVILSSDATGYQVEVLPAAGVTLNDPSGTSTVQPSEPLQLIRTGANNWRAYGGTGGFTGRGVFAGGNHGSPTIDYIAIQSLGNATSFGSLLQTRQTAGACSSLTRGVFGGGTVAGSTSSSIEYVTIAALGNATSFGSLTVARYSVGATSSSTRGLFAGGYLAGSTQYSTID